VNYLWPKPGNEQPVAKLSYSQRFAPVGLVSRHRHVHGRRAKRVLRQRALRWARDHGACSACSPPSRMLLVLRSIKRNLAGDLELAVSAAQRIARERPDDARARRGQRQSSLLYALATMQSGLVRDRCRGCGTGRRTSTSEHRRIAAGNTDLSQRTEQQAAASGVETASS